MSQTQNKKSQDQGSSRSKGPIKKVIAQSAEGFPLLGHLVYWTFTKMKLPYSEFQSILQKAGLPLDLAPETRKKSAIIRAAEEVTNMSRKSKFRRTPVDDEQSAVFTIVQEHVDVVNQGANYTTETKIVYHKESENVTVHGTPEMKDLVLKLVAEYMETYTTDQIRASLLQYLKDSEGCGGLMVRESGGLYFIPSTRMEEFKKLRKVFDTLQKQYSAVSVDVVPVIDTEEAASSMWNVLVGGVKEELNELKEDVAGLRANPTEFQQNIRHTRIMELSTKINMYSTLLNGTADGLEKELRAIEKSFISKLTEKRVSQNEN